MFSTLRPRKKPAHQVQLFLKGKPVALITMAATNPRFVKDKELFDLAYAEIQRYEAMPDAERNQSHEAIRPGAWNSFEVSFCGFRMIGNVAGDRILEAA